MYNPQIQDVFQKSVDTVMLNDVDPLMICYDCQTKLPIELKSVQYTVNIQLGLAIVSICQTYSTDQNKNQCELEYLFTINQNSAVTKMIVELGDQKVYAVIKELEEAKKEYQKGIEEGKIMVLSEENSKISNIKKVKIGYLSPGLSLKIQFEYIQSLQVCLNQFWKLELSPMIDTSYLTVNQLKSTQKNYAQQYSFVRQCVNVQAINLNYKQNVTVIIDIQQPITYAKSPTHSILLNSDINQQNDLQNHENQLIITLNPNDPQNMAPNKKFELLFSSTHINDPYSILTHTNNDALQHIKYCVTLTLIPKFNEFPIDDAYQSYISGLNLTQQAKMQKGCYIFLIDRSGSMENIRIHKAKQSLILFLKSLPMDCTFNIISFGSNFKKMFDCAQTYNQQTLNQAIKQVQEMNADFGGTDIYNALKNGIYDKNYFKNNNNAGTLNLFLLTDGEDSPDRIINLVKENERPETKIYTLGIGNYCSEYLVQKLAEVGNGKCQLVRDDEDINSKVIDLLEDSMSYYLKGFSLIHNIDKVSQIIPDPKSIINLQKNKELTIQVLFSSKEEKENLELKINCYDPQMNKQISYEIKLDLKSSKDNEYFHKLAAHKLIRYYEKSISQQLKQMDMIMVNQKFLKEQDIINLSLENQILCSKTAFICEVLQTQKYCKPLKNQEIYQRQEKVHDPPKQVSFFQKMLNFFQTDNHSSINMQPKFEDNFHRSQTLQVECCCNTIQNCNFDRYREQVDQSSQFDLQIKQTQQQSFDSQQNQNQESKYLPKQSIKCALKPKILKDDQQMLSYIDLIDCMQANGSFLLELAIEESLKLCKLENKYHLDDLCWSTMISLFYLELFCQDSKSSWALIYNKAISYLQQNGVNYYQIKTECISEYAQLFKKDKI